MIGVRGTMSDVRRILLIDPDLAFAQRLTQVLAPYHVDVVTIPDGAEALGRVTEIGPAALVIAVEEPEKLGYALCNKAKKGVAASLPVVLVTTTVTAQGFANHRRLKIHADEYLDKRTLSDDELLGKVDNLINLGEPAAPGDEEPVELDDVPV